MEVELQTNNRVDVTWIWNAMAEITLWETSHPVQLSSAKQYSSEIGSNWPFSSEIADGEAVVKEDHLGWLHRHQRLVGNKDQLVLGFCPAGHLETKLDWSYISTLMTYIDMTRVPVEWELVKLRNANDFNLCLEVVGEIHVGTILPRAQMGGLLQDFSKVQIYNFD